VYLAASISLECELPGLSWKGSIEFRIREEMKFVVKTLSDIQADFAVTSYHNF
jgi:hypothetical protein